MLLYTGTVSGLVHLALSQMSVLEELAWAGDHPGCPLLQGETETAWRRSVPCLLAGTSLGYTSSLPACPFFVAY